MRAQVSGSTETRFYAALEAAEMTEISTHRLWQNLRVSSHLYEENSPVITTAHFSPLSSGSFTKLFNIIKSWLWYVARIKCSFLIQSSPVKKVTWKQLFCLWMQSDIKLWPEHKINETSCDQIGWWIFDIIFRYCCDKHISQSECWGLVQWFKEPGLDSDLRRSSNTLVFVSISYVKLLKRWCI